MHRKTCFKALSSFSFLLTVQRPCFWWCSIPAGWVTHFPDCFSMGVLQKPPKHDLFYNPERIILIPKFMMLVKLSTQTYIFEPENYQIKFSAHSYIPLYRHLPPPPPHTHTHTGLDYGLLTELFLVSYGLVIVIFLFMLILLYLALGSPTWTKGGGVTLLAMLPVV